MHVRNRVTETEDYLQPGASMAPGLWQYCTTAIDLRGVSLFREIGFYKDSVLYGRRGLRFGCGKMLLLVLSGNFSACLCNCMEDTGYMCVL